MADYPDSVTTTARHLHDLLAARRYDEMESICAGIRLSADEIAEAISDYGCEVANTPSELQLDVLRITTIHNGWAVDIPVFTLEEGRSDLTLQVTMTESGGPVCNVELDNFHVL